ARTTQCTDTQRRTSTSRNTTLPASRTCVASEGTKGGICPTILLVAACPRQPREAEQLRFPRDANCETGTTKAQQTSGVSATRRHPRYADAPAPAQRMTVPSSGRLAVRQQVIPAGA